LDVVSSTVQSGPVKIGLLFASAWFINALYQTVQKEEADLTRRGWWSGAATLLFMGLIFAFSLVETAWEENSAPAGLKICATILGLFSITLPSLVGLARPVTVGEGPIFSSVFPNAVIEDHDVFVCGPFCHRFVQNDE